MNIARENSARFSPALLALALCACAPDVPKVTEQEAQATLSSFANGGGGLDVCTPEGRVKLRSAVRAHYATLQAQGQKWFDFKAIQSNKTMLTDVDAAVLAATSTGFIDQYDAHAPGGALEVLMGLPQPSQVSDPARGVRDACPQMLELERALARYGPTFQRAAARSFRYDDHRRDERESAIHDYDRMTNVRMQIRDLVKAAEAKLSAPKTS